MTDSLNSFCLVAAPHRAQSCLTLESAVKQTSVQTSLLAGFDTFDSWPRAAEGHISGGAVGLWALHRAAGSWAGLVAPQGRARFLQYHTCLKLVCSRLQHASHAHHGLLLSHRPILCKHHGVQAGSTW